MGGFDETLFLYFEDRDLSRRYHARGRQVGGTTAITVAHVGQGSSPGSEQIQAWAILSLLEFVAKWQGHREARRAACAALCALRAVSSLGRTAERLPVIGPRAAEKGASAARVTSALLACANHPPVDHAYPRARRALVPPIDARLPTAFCRKMFRAFSRL
jgi:hypothetical protein